MAVARVRISGVWYSWIISVGEVSGGGGGDLLARRS